MVDVGVDLHKNYSQVAVLDAWGEIRQEQIEHQGREMEEFVRNLEPASRLAVEATGNWWWFVDLVESQGHQVVMSNPKETKAIAHARPKNDRVDGETGGAAAQRFPASGLDCAGTDTLREGSFEVSESAGRDANEVAKPSRSNATEAESAHTRAEPLEPEGTGLRGERGLESRGGPDTT
jgi:hypothetical protein